MNNAAELVFRRIVHVDLEGNPSQKGFVHQVARL